MQPTFEQFCALAVNANCVPVTYTIIADDITPVSAFANLASDADRAFLFESVVGGEHVARFSFLGVNPTRTFSVSGGRLSLSNHRDGSRREWESSDPLQALQEELRGYSCATLPNLPRFLGGAVGYAAYDTVRYYERLPHSPHDDRGLPDLLFDVYETLALFDHVNKTMTVVQQVFVGDGRSEAELRRNYDDAIAHIREIVSAAFHRALLQTMHVSLPAAPLRRYSSNMTKTQFESMVARAKEYIRAGDIFQVVLSQRLQVDTPASPFDVYRALRVVNPSPFMFYLKAPLLTLVGASPEILCRVEERSVTNRPLAGTRPRGKSSEEDRRLMNELLADPKERAEHIMLVDLGRNDVGRVTRPGSVRLEEVMAVEFYSHVMHISSTVTGTLRDELSALDALRATLPVGTVSGAPKVRAMEIIDECEPTRRGPYGGAVGYLDFAGNLDTCIALRTLVFQPTDGGYRAFAQVGAGIVADSDPDAEFQETINKAGGMLAAIAVAEQNRAE